MTTEYSISKHRYYELKHFCLQYNDWKRLYLEANGWSGDGDTTSRDGIRRGDLKSYIELIEFCSQLTGYDILPYVTDDKLTIPAELRYAYYRFFWELSRRR